MKKQLTLNQKEYDLLKTKKDLSNFNIIIDNPPQRIVVINLSIPDKFQSLDKLTD